jgi:hypothetical protein
VLLGLGGRVERAEPLPEGGPGAGEQHPGVVRGDPELVGVLLTRSRRAARARVSSTPAWFAVIPSWSAAAR